MVASITIVLVVLPLVLAKSLFVVGLALPNLGNSTGVADPEGDTSSSADPDGRQSLSHLDLSNLPMDNRTYTVSKQRHMELQCKSLKMKMTISDGRCTSIKPVTSVLCVGHCLPEGDVPWYAWSIRIWSQSKKVEFSCEDDVIKRKRVELVCKNGETKSISLNVVRSCKCTRYNSEQNRPLPRNHGVQVQDLPGSWDNWSERRDNKDPRTRRKNNKNHRKRRKDRKRKKNRKRDRESHKAPSEL